MRITSSRKKRKKEYYQKRITIWIFLLYYLCVIYVACSVEKGPVCVFSHFKMMEKNLFTCNVYFPAESLEINDYFSVE